MRFSHYHFAVHRFGKPCLVLRMPSLSWSLRGLHPLLHLLCLLLMPLLHLLGLLLVVLFHLLFLSLVGILFRYLLIFLLLLLLQFLPFLLLLGILFFLLLLILLVLLRVACIWSSRFFRRRQVAHVHWRI